MTALSRPLAGYGSESRRFSQRIDFWLVLAAIGLIGVGLLSLYSEGYSRDGGVNFRHQIINGAIGLVPFTLFALVNPRAWLKGVNFLYLANVGILVLVLRMGKDANGAQRWINLGPLQFQPSELSKLLVILTLATFYAVRQDQIRSLSTFLLGFAHIAVPLVLIFLQPHLGAVLVLLVTWFAISLVAGVPFKFLGPAALVGLIVLGAALTVPAVRGKLLRSYQNDRVEGMMSSGKDSRGKDWQTDRAEIAFGAGGVFGSGFLHGEQKEKHFIPFQHTDFIFTVVGEEGGLVGCTLVLGLFAFFYYRAFLVLLHATDPYFRMIASGIFAMLVFHTFVNIGMVLHLLPVVGLWLPFLSYGGTALWLCMACVGLLINVRRRERPLLF